MKIKMKNNEIPRGRPDVTNPLLILTLLAVLTCPVAVRAQSAAPSAGIGQEVTNAADELTWPRESEVSGTKVDTYQPQIERRAGTSFETRSAVGITSPAPDTPV